MPRVPVRVLEAEASLAEVDLAGDASVHHPLQRAVDGGAADPVILVPDQIDEIVRAQVAFLAEEHIDDQIAVAAAFVDHEAVLEAGAPAALDEYAQPAAVLLLFREQLGNLAGRCRGYVDHLVSSPTVQL